MSSSLRTAVSTRPFSDALSLIPTGDGVYEAELGDAWTVLGGKQHGGLLMALVAKAALARLDAHTGAEVPSDPLAVSASFLRAPGMGPVRIDTEVVKVGRTMSVVHAQLWQGEQIMLSTTVTGGRLPDEPASWSSLPGLAPGMAAEPPSDGIHTASLPGPLPPMATACDVVLDAATARYLRGEVGEPVQRGWARPIGEDADPLFAVLAGDLLPPVLFNAGRIGWSPTVQLTALIRARPAPGWLRMRSLASAVAGTWLDEDATVVDSAGQLVCQARQLALAPLTR
jgi:acyl-coenzyme A thioesterase PaaI-like protein